MATRAQHAGYGAAAGTVLFPGAGTVLGGLLGSLFGGNLSGGGPPKIRGPEPGAPTTFDPYFLPTELRRSPGSPASYWAPEGLKNVAMQYALAQLGLNPQDWSFGPQQPLYNPPGQASVMDTLAGLQYMGGQPSGTAGFDPRAVQAQKQDIAGAGIGTERAMVGAEPQRLNQILSTLLGLYGFGSDIYGQMQALRGQSRKQQAAAQGQLAGFYGQIPIVGPLVGGIRNAGGR